MYKSTVFSSNCSKTLCSTSNNLFPWSVTCDTIESSEYWKVARRASIADINRSVIALAVACKLLSSIFRSSLWDEGIALLWVWSALLDYVVWLFAINVSIVDEGITKYHYINRISLYKWASRKKMCSITFSGKYIRSEVQRSAQLYAVKDNKESDKVQYFLNAVMSSK